MPVDALDFVFSGYRMCILLLIPYSINKCGDIFLLLLLCTFPISPSASLPCLVLCVQVVDLMQHPAGWHLIMHMTLSISMHCRNVHRFEKCTLTKTEKLILIFPFKNLTEPSSPGCRHTSHKKQFLPSPRLQRSLVWTNMTAHHQDSSLLLWDKSWHPRTLQALRILISKEYR